MCGGCHMFSSFSGSSCLVWPPSAPAECFVNFLKEASKSFHAVSTPVLKIPHFALPAVLNSSNFDCVSLY